MTLAAQSCVADLREGPVTIAQKPPDGGAMVKRLRADRMTVLLPTGPSSPVRQCASALCLWTPERRSLGERSVSLAFFVFVSQWRGAAARAR